MKKAIAIVAGSLFVSALSPTFAAGGSMNSTVKENSFNSTTNYQDTTNRKRDSTRLPKDSSRKEPARDSIKLINLRP